MKAHKTTREKNREIRHAMYQEVADQCIGKLDKGFDMFCLTKGQFSIINVIEAILKQVGQADVIISTWTAANAEISKAEQFIKNGNIRKLHWIVDRSFKTRQPKYYNMLKEKFGDAVISEIDSHAKFVLISNDKWKIAIRTSMNLNENKRLEQFEASDDVRLFDYLMMICDDILKDEYSWEKFKALGSGEKYKDLRPAKQKLLDFDFSSI